MKLSSGGKAIADFHDARVGVSDSGTSCGVEGFKGEALHSSVYRITLRLPVE
jgi:hypothetical protein